MDTRRGPFPKLRRHFRRGCDEGSASMASYVVAASVFILGSSYLLQFVVEPPGAGTATMDHQALRVNAQTALEVLLGTPGWPAAWDADVPGMKRLGLIERGTSLRIDPDKFDALARGKFATASADGYVDYAEAKDYLGVEGYDFHLRAFPVTTANSSATYGLEGMDGFRIAYVGNFTSAGDEATSSQMERWALDVLDVGFTNTTRFNTTLGDVYKDNSVDIRANLLPVIGPTIYQTELSAGAGTKYDFYRVNATSYDPLADPEVELPLGDPVPPLTSAMGLSSDGATLGYTKNRELRAIIGQFAVTGGAADIEWREFVDTDRGNLSYDCGDYGFVEVSYDGGSAWTRLTDDANARSQDCDTGSNTHGTEMTRRTAAFADCNCTSATLAYHWVGDNDNNVGYGWIVDDVEVTSGAETRLIESFSAPEYDMLIIGSDVDHNAFTPNDIKDGIRDYVDLYGGRLVVLGGEQNRQWLDRLFDAGTGGGSGGVAAPDTTHPLLTLPNQLSYGSYTSTATWDFEDEEASLFSMIMGETGTSQRLSVSRPGAWSGGGSADGAVILTSYEPHEWEVNETRAFFANAAIYGKFHYLFLEVGPEVPSGEAVASVSRSATMNKYRTGEANYTEMAFILYLWPGTSSDQTYATSAITPTAPRSVTAQSSDDHAWVNWTFPISNGTQNVTAFEVWRGYGPTTIGGPALITIPVTLADLAASNTWTFSYHDTVVDNGITYYYNVTAVNAEGRGTPSTAASTTPLTLPPAPTASAATLPGRVRVSWNDPGSAATGTILGYRITASTDGSTYGLVGEVGSVTIYDHAPGDEIARTYKVEALNARGYGAASTATNPTAAGPTTPISAPAVSAAPTPLTPDSITVSWVAPADLLGQTLQGWRIWRSTSEAGSYAELAYVATPSAASYQDADLGGVATHWYKVQGITDAGEGLNSTATSGTALAPATAPTSFSVSNATAGSLTLSWLAPVDIGGGTASGYRVWRSTDGSAWSELATMSDPLNTSFEDVGLGTNVTRHYKVQAMTSAGPGTNTSSVSEKTKGVPFPPHSVLASSTILTTTVAWTDGYTDAAITQYEVCTEDTQVGLYDVCEISAVNPWTQAADNTGKWFKVRAASAIGWSAFSDPDQA